MWNGYAKKAPLRKACEHLGIQSASDFIDTLCQKAKTDKELNPLMADLLGILEPKSCDMYHCESNGGQSCFCNCIKAHNSTDGFIPTKCAKLRAFHKRRKERRRNNGEIVDPLFIGDSVYVEWPGAWGDAFHGTSGMVIEDLKTIKPDGHASVALGPNAYPYSVPLTHLRRCR